MEKIETNNSISGYLRFPLYIFILIALAAAGLCFYDRKLIPFAFIFILIIVVISVIYYFIIQKKTQKLIVKFATDINSAQKEIIENMPIPYAVIEKNGNIHWMNSIFKETFGISKTEVSLTKLFKEINLNDLKEMGEEGLSTQVIYENSYFTAVIDKISNDKNTSEEISLFTIMLFDNTEKLNLYNKLDANKLVIGNIYIDNFEDILDEVEDVKSSLLQAVIERKLRKYFGEADAIIRKLEKDRFFIVFPKKFLGKLIDDKFSILEDIKNTKIGNDLEITLSIGLGLGGDTYARTAEYAKSATSLALGRGGSQVVIKECGEVDIYGNKGKEFATNARVKARVKAQALKELIATRERVVIMGHAISDSDCLGAAIGIMAAARNMGKPYNIVLNTVTGSLKPLAESLLEDGDYPDDIFINNFQALELVNKKTLLVIVDTNRPTNTECPELLQKTKDVVVFDHHRQGKEIIQEPILSYIEPYASSTCEMVAEILQYFSDDIEISAKEADSMYAGILIDTNNFMTKTGVKTFEAAAYLRRLGAEVTRVRKLLREDINTYKARAEIVRRAQVYREAFAISVCNTSELDSPTVVGAQASNELLNIVGIKASFVLTEFKGKIYISSRSLDDIDVQSMMENLGGGGHLNIAGAQIENGTIEEVINKIKEIIDRMIEEGKIK